MRKLLDVFFIWLLVAQTSFQAEEDSAKCEYIHEQEGQVAHCEHLVDFPNNLKSKIVGLYLRWTVIDEINDHTFENLHSIKYLYLENNPGLSISPGAFDPLTGLHTLDLSFNKVADMSKIRFPETLEILYLTKVKNVENTTKLHISSLVELKILVLSDNQLDQIPSFGDPIPSLEKLDLSANSLKYFKLDSLAGLCKLKVLDISSDASIQDNCECLRLNKWIKDRGITGSNLTCKPSKTCNTSPSATFNQIYGSCETEATIRLLCKILFYVFSIIFIILVVSFSCVVMYVRCNRKDFSDDTIRAYFYFKKKQTQTEETISLECSTLPGQSTN